MTAPIGVGVAYGQAAFTETPTYTSISNPAAIHAEAGWTVRRGRSYFTDKMDAGTSSVTTIDTAGKIDPTNASGPFYPMNPNCPAVVCLQNAFTGNWVPIFTGLIQGCPQEINVDSVANRGTLELADLFSLFAIDEVPPGLDYTDNMDGTYTAVANTTGNTKYPESTVQDRIKALLADIGVPAGLTDIFSGNVRVQETVYSPGDKILTALQDAADAEFPGVANIYISKTGIVTFHGRLARFNPTDPTYNINTWHVGDTAAVEVDTGKASLASFSIDRDVTKVINNALFTPNGILDKDIAAQLTADSGSITQYGPRGLTGENLINAGATTGPLAGDPRGETKLDSDFYVDNFKDAQTRIQQARFRWRDPGKANAAAHWAFLCNVELNDVVVVTTTHRGGGGFTAERYFVEGITYKRGLGPELTLTLDLSPAAYYTTQPSHWDNT